MNICDDLVDTVDEVVALSVSDLETSLEPDDNDGSLVKDAEQPCMQRDFEESTLQETNEDNVCDRKGETTGELDRADDRVNKAEQEGQTEVEEKTLASEEGSNGENAHSCCESNIIPPEEQRDKEESNQDSSKGNRPSSAENTHDKKAEKSSSFIEDTNSNGNAKVEEADNVCDELEHLEDTGIESEEPALENIGASGDVENGKNHNTEESRIEELRDPHTDKTDADNVSDGAAKPDQTTEAQEDVANEEIEKKEASDETDNKPKPIGASHKEGVDVEEPEEMVKTEPADELSPGLNVLQEEGLAPMEEIADTEAESMLKIAKKDSAPSEEIEQENNTKLKEETDATASEFQVAREEFASKAETQLEVTAGEESQTKEAESKFGSEEESEVARDEETEAGQQEVSAQEKTGKDDEEAEDQTFAKDGDEVEEERKLRESCDSSCGLGEIRNDENLEIQPGQDVQINHSDVPAFGDVSKQSAKSEQQFCLL